MTEQQHPLAVVVLISGSGTNLQAIIDAAANDLPIDIRAVISNRPGAYGLERARKAGIPTEVLDHTQFPDRESFDAELARLIDSHEPHLVVLAGFMRILTPGFVNHYAGRMLNIHPSLLPCFPGLHTHEQALAMGVKVHGATVHFVTAELDHGPIVLQAAIEVRQGDTPDSLAGRLLTQEHVIYPRAVRWFVEGRLRVEQGVVRVSPDASQLVIGVDAQEAA